jgi:NAD(P)-dependent dehydrogenase (short-subunit alcohol dehydrogenase family)
MKLRDEVAIITGGGRGIGKAVAEGFVREGARVVIASEIEDELTQVSKELGVDYLKTDVTRITEVKRLIKYAVSKFGKLDVLINAAGMQTPIGPLLNVNAAAWKKAVDVNLVGTMLCCKFSLPPMISNKKGKIVNIGGGGAISPRPNFSAYASSKAAVIRFSETLAEEVKEFNIDVNTIHPGSVNTQMNHDVVAAGLDLAGEAEYKNAVDVQSGNTVPMTDVQEFITFLASSDSDGITGRTLYNVWDAWRDLTKESLGKSALYTLRRIDGRKFFEK